MRLCKRALRSAWCRWLKVAVILGNVQMIVLLALVYWTVFALVAVPFRLFADPLGFRRRGRPQWNPRPPLPTGGRWMRDQG